MYNSVYLSSGDEQTVLGGRGIPNGKLYFRFDHRRDAVEGATLTNGDVRYKLKEMMKADPFGLGGLVDVGDEVVAGKVFLQHTTS